VNGEITSIRWFEAGATHSPPMNRVSFVSMRAPQDRI
jgi:hypothetical protein